MSGLLRFLISNPWKIGKNPSIGSDCWDFWFQIVEKSGKILLWVRIAETLDFKSLKNREKSFYRSGLLRFWISNRWKIWENPSMIPDRWDFGFQIVEKSGKILLWVRIAEILDFKSLNNLEKSYRYGLPRFWISNRWKSVKNPSIGADCWDFGFEILEKSGKILL
jgi:hypothetical protein